MTKRLPATPAPGPLEDYAARFDDLFGTLAQRQVFRRYLEGLLLPTERNKTLTALWPTPSPWWERSVKRGAGSAVVPLGVGLGPRAGKQAQGRAVAQRSEDCSETRRRAGHRRNRRSQGRQKDRSHRQAVPGRRRQDRQWRSIGKFSSGRRENLLSPGGRALHSRSPLLGRQGRSRISY